jgi:hypothetical protein
MAPVRGSIWSQTGAGSRDVFCAGFSRTLRRKDVAIDKLNRLLSFLERRRYRAGCGRGTMATAQCAHATTGQHYQQLIIMAMLSMVSMYFLMYAMVDQPSNVYGNLNQFFMAALMTTPMVVIELIVMRDMYPNARRNALIIAMSLIVGVAMFLFIRRQAAITDEQFLRSMIPHHSGAILMCERAQLQNPELRELCDAIIESQREEIDLMAALLQQQQ